MVMKVLRRAAYGFGAWLFVFALASLLAVYAKNYVFLVLLAAPFAFYWLAVHSLRKKRPDFGGDGLKVGAIWMLVAAVLDLVIIPFWNVPYLAFLSAGYNVVIYLEMIIVSWFADKHMTGRRKI